MLAHAMEPIRKDRQRRQRAVRLASASCLVVAAPVPFCSGFAAADGGASSSFRVPPRSHGTIHSHALQPSPLAAAEMGPPAKLSRLHGRRRRGERTARRIFDTGSLFGVGFPEAAVIALLGWFLLGPEELFKLSKQAGNWLGELRTYVGQAAKQYESALDDDSTRQAIAGIRETQKTVSEIGQSWSTISNTLRDPLNMGGTLSSTFSKYSDMPADTSTELSKGQFVKPSDKNPAEVTSDFESVEMSPGKEEDWENETPEELERKRAASREAAKALMYNPNKEAAEEKSTPALKDLVGRLDRRMQQLDDMVDALDELKSGILRDREQLQERLKQEEKAVAENPKGEESSEPSTVVEKTENKPMAVVEAAGVKAPVDSLTN